LKVGGIQQALSRFDRVLRHHPLRQGHDL
jgi:hypothetical protein